MPRLELTDHELVVHLTVWESIWSLRRSFRVPLAHVRGATEDNGFGGNALGLRIPGTYVPGLIAAGTFIKGRDKQFVAPRPRRLGSQHALGHVLPRRRASASCMRTGSLKAAP
jgi:hypothetical protein